MCARIVALVRDIILVEITEFCRRAEEEHLIRVPPPVNCGKGQNLVAFGYVVQTCN